MSTAVIEFRGETIDLTDRNEDLRDGINIAKKCLSEAVKHDDFGMAKHFAGVARDAALLVDLTDAIERAQRSRSRDAVLTLLGLLGLEEAVEPEDSE